MRLSYSLVDKWSHSRIPSDFSLALYSLPWSLTFRFGHVLEFLKLVIMFICVCGSCLNIVSDFIFYPDHLILIWSISDAFQWVFVILNGQLSFLTFIFQNLNFQVELSWLNFSLCCWFPDLGPELIILLHLSCVWAHFEVVIFKSGHALKFFVFLPMCVCVCVFMHGVCKVVYWSLFYDLYCIRSQIFFYFSYLKL